MDVKSGEGDLRAHRESVAWGVIKHFGERVPKARALCFLDAQDWDEYKTKRGFYLPMAGSQIYRAALPTALKSALFPEGDTAFGHLIYLNDSTCASDIGLVMTLAHELQHFIQHESHPLEYAANALAFELLKGLDTPSCQRIGTTRSFEHPLEHEARLVSKRTAESLLGREVVEQFIQSKVGNSVDPEEASDWRFVQRLDTSVEYDLVSETRALYLRLREHGPRLRGLLRPEASLHGEHLNALLDVD